MQQKIKIEKPKILVLTYFHPPLESVTVIRNAALIPEFQKIFSETYVLTSSNIKFLPNYENYKPSYTLLKVPTFDFRTLLFLLSSKNNNSQVSQESKQNLLAKYFLKLKASFPFSLLLSEGSLLYIFSASFKSIRLIRRNKMTHLFSSFYPLCDIYAGYLIKLFCPKIIWVCDFRDLPVDPYFENTYFPKFQDNVLKHMLKRATKLTTISEGLKNHVLKYNPQVKVVRNGIDAELFNFQREPFNKFSIGYTGSIYGYDATLLFLSKILKNLKDKNIISEDNFQIVYAGKDGVILDRFLKESAVNMFINSIGQVKREQALEVQRNAHINLIFSYTLPNFTGILTGKLFEYLAAQPPILVLIDGVQDTEFENILTELSAGKVFYTDKDLDSAVAWIGNQFLEWKINGSVAPKVNSEKIKEMKWRDAAEKIF